MESKVSKIFGDYEITVFIQLNFENNEYISDFSINEYSFTFFFINLINSLKEDIQRKNSVSIQFNDGHKMIWYNMRCYPRIKIGELLHIPKKESKEIMNFILYLCRPLEERRNSEINSLLSED